METLFIVKTKVIVVGKLERKIYLVESIDKNNVMEKII